MAAATILKNRKIAISRPHQLKDSLTHCEITVAYLLWKSAVKCWIGSVCSLHAFNRRMSTVLLRLSTLMRARTISTVLPYNYSAAAALRGVCLQAMQQVLV